MTAARVPIGEAARLSELSVDAIRYYERRALLPRLPRTAGRYRAFDQTAVERLRFIRRAQGWGFTLREIGQLSGAHAGREPDCACVQELLQTKLDQLRRRRGQIAQFERELRGILAGCQCQGSQQPCGALTRSERP